MGSPEYEVQSGGPEHPWPVGGEPGLPGPESLQQLQQQPRRLPQHHHDLVPVQQGKICYSAALDISLDVSDLYFEGIHKVGPGGAELAVMGLFSIP